MTKGLKWKNTNAIVGVNYLSPLKGVCSCEAINIKRSDDEFFVTLNSLDYKKENKIENQKPLLRVDNCVNLSFIFSLYEYKYMYKRPWRGEEDAENRLKPISWQCNFYANKKLIGVVKSNAYNQSNSSVILYDTEWSISKPIPYGDGAAYDFHHTNSVHYYIDLKNDIYVFYRGKQKIIDFYAEMTIFDWLAWHKIVDTSFIKNLEYTYVTENESDVDGSIIFYEDD